MLAAIGEPADAPSETLRGLENKRIFPIDDGLGAEPAADILRDDAKGFGRNFQHRPGDGALNAVHALTSKIQREAAGFRIIFANGRARLHIIGDHARVDDLDANRVRCAGERLIRLLLIADMGVVSDVTRSIREDKRRVRPQSIFHVGHDGKRVPCHADQFGAVARLESRVGDHHRDNVADVLRFI